MRPGSHITALADVVQAVLDVPDVGPLHLGDRADYHAQTVQLVEHADDECSVLGSGPQANVANARRRDRKPFLVRGRTGCWVVD